MAYRQYIGSRYVPIFGRKGEDTYEWDNSAPYEPLTVVMHQGNSFTSVQYVPTGIDINNRRYWAETGNWNAQVEQYRAELQRYIEQVNGFNNRITTTENGITTINGEIGNGFDSTNTVAKAINDTLDIIGTGFDSTNTVAKAINDTQDVIGTGFDSTNTVAKAINDTQDVIGTGFDSTNTVAKTINILGNKLFTQPNFRVKDRFIYGEYNNAEGINSAQAGCVFTQDGVNYWAQIMSSDQISNDKLIIRNIDTNTLVKELQGQFGHGFTLSYNPYTKQLLTQDSETSPKTIIIFNVANIANAYLESTIPLTNISLENPCWYDSDSIIGVSGNDWIVYDLNLNYIKTFTIDLHGYSYANGYIFQNICWDAENKMCYIGVTQPDGIIICDIDFDTNTISMKDFIACKPYYRYIYMRELEFAYRNNDCMYINQYDQIDGLLVVTLLEWDMINGTIPDENSKYIQPTGNIGFTIDYEKGSLMPLASKDLSTYKLAGDAINEARSIGSYSRAYLIFANDYPHIVEIRSCKCGIQTTKEVHVKGFSFVNADVYWSASHNVTVDAENHISGSSYCGLKAVLCDFFVVTSLGYLALLDANYQNNSNAYCVYMENTEYQALQYSVNFTNKDWFRWCDIVTASEATIENATVYNCAKTYRS